jgi:acetyltransferase-like isoleucine patch superfamily enzyme
MKEYDKMLAGEYHFPYKYGVVDQCMMELQEKARIDLEKYNAIPNSDYEEKLACLKSISKECVQAMVCSPVTWEFGCHLSFGKSVFINFGCLMLDGAEIKFGNRIAVGPRSMFLTAGHPVEPEKRWILNKNGEEVGCCINKPICVMDDVYIGAGAIILGGVTIGSGSTVGAGSVVTKSVPERVVVAGNPAKVIRTIPAK